MRGGQSRLDGADGHRTRRVGLERIVGCGHVLAQPVLDGAVPRYEVLPGWNEPLDGVESFSDLPDEARAYVVARANFEKLMTRVNQLFAAYSLR